MQKHLIKRVEDNGSFSYLQAGNMILCWHDLDTAYVVVGLLNLTRKKASYSYEVDIDGGEDGIIVDL